MIKGKLSTPYMKAQQKSRSKEVAATKNYIKNIWGADIKIKKMSYSEIRKLGGELGMNVYNTKGFDDKKSFKNCACICKYCKKSYDIKIKKKVRPRNYGVCLFCKKKSYKERFEKRKIKNKIKYERLILESLNKYGRMTISELANKMGCSEYPIRKIFKNMKKEGKIEISKATTVKII